uniref:Uncharacterized protein n=1 Tax=Timspurckia oligopyrenoides TaxID=708627 RepID=A0A7S0ZGE4_9RHOD|mmetsp:Transcript_4093/g.7194  ORF Transcript_4093/g.7194 Transcript_4093/m.7194 type:complete len:172 (+) Transcript_4093:42-557(+)
MVEDDDGVELNWYGKLRQHPYFPRFPFEEVKYWDWYPLRMLRFHAQLKQHNVPPPERETTERFYREVPVYGERLERMHNSVKIGGYSLIIGTLTFGITSRRYLKNPFGLVVAALSSYAMGELGSGLLLGNYTFSQLTVSERFLEWYLLENGITPIPVRKKPTPENSTQASG